MQYNLSQIHLVPKDTIFTIELDTENFYTNMCIYNTWFRTAETTTQLANTPWQNTKTDSTVSKGFVQIKVDYSDHMFHKPKINIPPKGRKLMIPKENLNG